jgi:hypothetical protein
MVLLLHAQVEHGKTGIEPFRLLLWQGADGSGDEGSVCFDWQNAT